MVASSIHGPAPYKDLNALTSTITARSTGSLSSYCSSSASSLYASLSTAPTAASGSEGRVPSRRGIACGDDDSAAALTYTRPTVPPPAEKRSSTSSVNTYDSALSDEDDSDLADEDDDGEDRGNAEAAHDTLRGRCLVRRDDTIPLVLPAYRASIADPTVRPSNPDAFARLFPSLDRLSIRHDDFTADGNMNLRVDTLVNQPPRTDDPDDGTDKCVRRPFSVQLFHLRMHDLARRDFSLRRYCRDSGREVCNSKRTYTRGSDAGAGGGGPVSSALHSVAAPLKRSATVASAIFKWPGSSDHNSDGTASARWSHDSRRPSVSSISSLSSLSNRAVAPAQQHFVPTETIKLEFTNYARVDVTRRKRKRRQQSYDFSWWGHSYAWNRAVDCNVEGAPVSFHLVRDGSGPPMAHIVPETQSPSEVETEEKSGGWIPPCHMWISDKSVIEAATDVADVIVATGLMAMVDDTIKRRWETKKQPLHRPPTYHGDDLTSSTHSGKLHGLFHRRFSEQQAQPPSRFDNEVTAC